MCCCENYPIEIRAQSVAVADGVTTITLPASPAINDGNVVKIILATPIPDGTDGTQIEISNGTVTGSLMNGNGNYFRAPYPLWSHTVIMAQYLGDPEHWQILKFPVRRNYNG